MNLNDVIKKPVLTEKTYSQMDLGYYTFIVNKKTNKIEIKKAVELIWNVKVAKINVLNVSRKAKRMGKYTGFKAGYKKAIVKLAEGTINFFPDDEDTKKDIKEVSAKKVVKKSKDQLEKEAKIEAKIKAKLEAKKTATSKKVTKVTKSTTDKKVAKVTKVTKTVSKKNDKKST